MKADEKVIPVIVGPTAVGKTGIAVRVAERLDAEIISSDSRQIFRQMQIGTAVPDEDALSRVRHHLIQELDIGHDYSAGVFAQMARERIADILGRGKRVVVTGGSTLYLRALTEGLNDIPDIDPSIREALTKRLRTEGSAPLYRELINADPEFASTLDETKSQRIVRGLEVYLGTGRPLSYYHKPSRQDSGKYDITVLVRPRPLLYNRINRRVDEMMDSGLVDEVRDVLDFSEERGADLPPTIGYRELVPVLRGDRTLDEGVRLIKRNSRRYAKRQLTWYRDLDEAVWVDLEEQSEIDVIDDIAARSR